MVCGVLGLVVFGLSLSRIEPLPVSRAENHFSEKAADAWMRKLAKGFPGRVSWSDSRRRAAVWLKDELRKMGYIPHSMMFSETIAGNLYTDLENIYVERPGTRHPEEIIVAMAHYDVTDTTQEGAMDDASGVGVVLELARLFAKEPTDRTLVFLLTDSEEFGAFWGARSFAASYEKADQIVATANFDFVAPGKQTGILTLCDGLKSGYTPLWLRELALDSLRSLNLTQVVDLNGVEEFIERAMLIPPADHGAFLAANIPAFNWVGQTSNFSYVMSHFHHTPHDVAEIMRPESFEAFGKGAERLIRSVSELPKVPKNFRDSSYWKLTERYYLPGWASFFLHLLAFLPFLAYSLAKFGKVFQSFKPKQVVSVIKNELKIILILLGSFLLGYALILMLPPLKIITQYETFPATQKSLILYNPNFVAILLVVGTILGVYWLFRNTFAHPDDSVDDSTVSIRHAVQSGLLALIILLAFMKNSYLAVLLLLPPAYFWTSIRARKRTDGKILNGIFVLAGAATFLATAILLGTIFHIGVFYWYLFLAAAYGLISVYSVVLFLMATAVMVRLFKSFVL